jgi:hypothetical protein
MIKRALLVLAFILLSAIAAYGQGRVQPTLDEMITARAKLIDRYVVKKGYAWGVSVCGNTDGFTGDELSYLTVYVYEESVGVFADDLAIYGTRIGNTKYFAVNGIPIFMEIIKHPKGKTHERPAKTERNDRKPVYNDRRASFTLPS